MELTKKNHNFIQIQKNLDTNYFKTTIVIFQF